MSLMSRKLDILPIRSFFRFSVIAILLLILNSGCAHIVVSKQERLLVKTHYLEAEKLMESKIKDYSSAESPDLIILCITYSKLKKYNKLFSCLEQLESNIKKGDNRGVRSWRKTGGQIPNDITPFPHLLKAEAYLELGNYGKAVESAKKAHELLMTIQLPLTDRLAGWDTRYKIRSLSLLALCYALNGDHNNALEYIDRLENAPIGFMGCIPLKMEKSLGLAKAYMAMREYDKVLSNKEKFLYAFTKVTAAIVLGDANFFAFTTLPKQFMMTKSLYETGRIKEAKEGYDKLLSNPNTKYIGELYWPILFDRGKIAQAEGDLEEAIEFYKKAISVIEAQRSTINTEASKIGFVGNKQEVYGFLVEQLIEIGRYDEAFEYAERAKARALVDILASKKHFGGGEMSGQNRLNALLDNLEEAELNNLAQDDQMLPQKYANTRSVTVQIKKRISQNDPNLASLVTVTSSDTADIQQLLPSNETLIEYYGTEDTLFAFIVSRFGIKGMKLEVKGLRQKVEAFREHIMDPGSYQFKADGQALYEKLIKPIEGMIASKNLTIVPHGALHYLPFNALYSERGYLIDQYNIRVLPSASVMKFLKDRPEGHAWNLLAFGNPDLGDTTYDLPGAQKEAMAITKDQPKSKLFIRKQATETALKRFGEQFRYIHFATHGTFDAEKPLSSGLLMTGDGENDGTLTVGELYELHLPADLVTLSACETALGKVANGDDVIGFNRGFLYAGVSSIVSSLWKVADKATSILMQQFYKSLKESDKRSALRAAQLRVKNSYNAHPYFWAAFQITGSVE